MSWAEFQKQLEMVRDIKFKLIKQEKSTTNVEPEPKPALKKVAAKKAAPPVDPEEEEKKRIRKEQVIDNFI